ncbi:MAG: zinc ribbon domain-containing protein [Terracidiphilus sp.]|jgi:zinc ribbon protein
MAAFCSKCGAHVEENEHFCPKCGNDVTAGAAAPAVAAAPVAAAPVPMAPPPPVYAAPPPPPQGYAAPPPQGYGAPPLSTPYVVPGQAPIPVVVPAADGAKKNNMLWLAIAVAAAAGGWYYYHKPPPTPTPTPATQTQPTTPPGGAPPGPATPAQPGGPGPGGPNAALVQQQQWSSQEAPANGYVQVQNGKWTNGSTVAMASAVLECDQYDANQTVLAQNQATLTPNNPPLAAGSYVTLNPFNMGQVVQNVNSVNCGIVAVTPAQ